MTTPNEVRNEWLGLGVATILTAYAAYLVPSWTGALGDPCRQAMILAALTIVLLFITRSLGPRGIAVERIVLAFFLAGMPLIYIRRWFLEGPQSASWLGVEIFGLAVYAVLALLGYRKSPWILAAGIAAHGLVWDAIHYRSDYIPTWYAIGCLVVDVGLGLYIAARIPAWRQAEA